MMIVDEIDYIERALIYSVKDLRRLSVDDDHFEDQVCLRIQ